MILINLLPHREAARKRKKEAFFVSLGIAALVGGLICGVIYTWYQAQISAQKDKNLFLSLEIKKLEVQIKDIATLQAEIAALRARQQAVEDLQSNRNMPVYLLGELVKQLPDGVYLTSLRQEGSNVTIVGVAQSNERVSELLRNLANKSEWFSRPELKEIVTSTVSLSARDQRRVGNFNLVVQLKRPADAQKAAAAAASATAQGARPASTAASAASTKS